MITLGSYDTISFLLESISSVSKCDIMLQFPVESGDLLRGTAYLRTVSALAELCDQAADRIPACRQFPSSFDAQSGVRQH